jgi:hypothetical protein
MATGPVQQGRGAALFPGILLPGQTIAGDASSRSYQIAPEPAGELAASAAGWGEPQQAPPGR